MTMMDSPTIISGTFSRGGNPLSGCTILPFVHID